MINANGIGDVAMDLLRRIIIREMSLDPSRVNIFNQRFAIPTDDGMFIYLECLPSKMISNRNITAQGGAGLQEIQELNTWEQVNIGVFSKNLEALQRKEEVVMALYSQYAQQVQDANSFRIFQMSPIQDLTRLEGTSQLYRYDITVTLHAWYQKIKAVEYFDQFKTRVLTESAEDSFSQNSSSSSSSSISQNSSSSSSVSSSSVSSSSQSSSSMSSSSSVSSSSRFSSSCSSSSNSSSNSSSSRSVSSSSSSYAVGDAIVCEGDNIKNSSPSNFPTGNDAFSVGCWFKSTSIGTAEFLMYIGETSGAGVPSGFHLLTNFPNPGQIGMGFSWNGFVVVGSGYLDGNWHRMIGTYDGSGKVKAYFDGQLLQTNTNVAVGQLTSRISIGCDNTGGVNFYGDIDEAFVFKNKVMTLSEVQADYNSGLAVRMSPQTDLVALYHFDDNLFDRSGQGNNLTDSGVAHYVRGIVPAGVDSSSSSSSSSQSSSSSKSSSSSQSSSSSKSSSSSSSSNAAGHALYFNGGTDGTVSQGDIFVPSMLNNDFTVAAWVQLSGTSPYSSILCGGEGALGWGWAIYRGSTTNAFSIVAADGTEFKADFSAIDMGLHLLMGIRSGDYIYSYVDNILINSTYVGGVSVRGVSPVNMGFVTSTDNLFTGTVDNVVIYDKALDSTGRDAVWNSGGGTNTPPADSLAMQWNCDDGSGGIVTDSSGNGYDGVFANYPTSTDVDWTIGLVPK